MNKRLKIFLGCLLILALVLFILLFRVYKTKNSLRIVDEYPLYVIDYQSGYFLDWVLGIGVDGKIGQIFFSRTLFSQSTTFAATNPEGDVLFARSFESGYQPVFLVYTDPPDGYASVSFMRIDDLERWEQGGTLGDIAKYLLIPYSAVDGMNEVGLAVSMMSVPCRIGPDDPQKVSITASQVVRLVLDRAKNVEEAIALIKGYNVKFAATCAHHMLADAFGNTAIVEYIDGQVVVTRSAEMWQVATNFIVSEYMPERADAPCWRYIRAYNRLLDAHGNISQSGALTLLKDISNIPIYTVIYNLNTGVFHLVMGGNYNRVYKFSLPFQPEDPNWRPNVEEAFVLP